MNVCLRVYLRCDVRVRTAYSTSYVCTMVAHTHTHTYIRVCLRTVKTNKIEICAFFLVKALFTWFLTRKLASSSSVYTRTYMQVMWNKYFMAIITHTIFMSKTHTHAYYAHIKCVDILIHLYQHIQQSRALYSALPKHVEQNTYLNYKGFLQLM